LPERLLLKAVEAIREGERILETLSPDSFDYELVLTAIARLRNAHGELASRLGTGSTFDRKQYKSITDEAIAVIDAVGSKEG
jgi:hypothetical protein